MIKGIFFDAAGVLYCRASPTENYALGLLREAGFSSALPAEDLASLLALHARASRGEVDHEAYWDEFLKKHGIEDPATRQAFTARIIAYSNEVSPVPGAREALQELKRRGFLLGIVTDTMYPLEWKKRRLEKAGVADFIDVIACSTDLGVHKPDPRIYLNAVQQANLVPAESVFVGHLAIELQGARAAGLLTVAVNSEPGAQSDHPCESIADLPDLPIFMVAAQRSEAVG
jgi:putative hydrolase of the HAD superfamily